MKKYVESQHVRTGSSTPTWLPRSWRKLPETGNQIKVETQDRLVLRNESQLMTSARLMLWLLPTLRSILTRFDGKRVLVTGVQDGITPSRAFEQALTAPDLWGASRRLRRASRRNGNYLGQ